MFACKHKMLFFLAINCIVFQVAFFFLFLKKYRKLICVILLWLSFSLLVTSDGTLIKITDFGLAAYIQDAKKFNFVGTLKAMAPEMIEGQYIDQYFYDYFAFMQK